MKAFLTAAVVLIAVQPAFAQPRTPIETVDCVITEAAYYRQRLIRDFPVQNPMDPGAQSKNDPLVMVATKAIADAIASKCGTAK